MSNCTAECDLAELCTQRHWSIYWLIIIAAFIFATGRVLTLGIDAGNGEKTPFMSANDRSRWATVRSLGDHGTYVIDDVIDDTSNGIFWNTIDKVRHLDRDGQPHYYSSKPPLLSTLVACIYSNVKSLTGLNLTEQTLPTAKVLLLIVNAIPWLCFLYLLASTLEKLQLRDWTRYFIVTSAGFATFLSTFVVTLNNHLPAAIFVMATLYCLVWIVNFDNVDWKTYLLTGFAAAFTAALELPALSFLAITATICFFKSPAKFLLGFLPTCLVVVAGFLWTNHLAHDDWRPPYMHKSDGERIEIFTGPEFAANLDFNRIPEQLTKSLEKFELVAPSIAPADWPFENDTKQRWIVKDITANRFTILAIEGSDVFELRKWDNWYDYEGSYWTSSQKSLLDQGEPDAANYFFHTLFGHHGIFSLTPIWLLSFAGMIAITGTSKFKMQWFGAMTILLTVTVFSFYIFYLPAHDRNYGGITSTFRWALWLAPLWLICMAPVVEWLGKSKRGRAVCIFLLLASALSALYSADNPWTHPWLYEVWEYTGLPK